MDDLSPDTLNEISKYAKALEEKNRIEQSRLNIDKRKEQLQLDVIASSEHLKQEVRLVISEIREFVCKQIQRDEWQDKMIEELLARIENIEERLDRLDHNQIILLAHNPEKREQARRELEEETQLRSLLKKHIQNLNKLKEQAANYGATNTPLELSNRIEAEEIKVAELQERLQ